MKKSVRLALYAGIAAGTALAVKNISDTITKVFIREAMDREEPKTVKRAIEHIAAPFRETEGYRQGMENARLLEAKPHERIEIEARDGTKLVGHFYKNEQAKRVLIAMHGWRSSWSLDFGTSAGFCLDSGCSLLFAEQRGQGESGGSYMSFGLVERYDCVDWVRWVNENYRDDLPIYLLGISMGGTTVLMAAGLDLPANVHGIISDCAFTSPNAIWKHICEDGMHLSYGHRQHLADDLFRQKLRIGSEDASTVEALQHTDVPVLLIHGSDDTFVPVTMTYENYRACVSPKHLLIVPGAEHGISYLVETKKYQDAVLSFWETYDDRPRGGDPSDC